MGSRTRVSSVKRGEVISHAVRERQFVVISCNALNNVGAVVVAEIAGVIPAGARGMLAVPLADTDPVPGAVLAWRVNYLSAERLGESLGELSPDTLERVDAAVRAALEL